MLEAVKPPAQTVGAQGIAPRPAPQGIAWDRLVHLPPFQRYATQQMRAHAEHNAVQHAAAFVQARGPTQELYAQYVAWHAAVGLWPGETPDGRLLEG